MSLLFTSFHRSSTSGSMAKCHCTSEAAQMPMAKLFNWNTNKTYWEPQCFDPPKLWLNSYLSPYMQRLKTVYLWHFSATQANRAAPWALPFTLWPYHTEQRSTEWSLKTTGTQSAVGAREVVKAKIEVIEVLLHIYITHCCLTWKKKTKEKERQKKKWKYF